MAKTHNLTRRKHYVKSDAAPAVAVDKFDGELSIVVYDEDGSTRNVLVAMSAYMVASLARSCLAYLDYKAARFAEMARKARATE